MKRSYYLAAMAMVIMMIAGTAVADYVDIGLGRMDRSEFESLKQIMRGEQPRGTSVTTERPEMIRVAEFDLSVIEAIRQAMSDSGPQTSQPAPAPGRSLVDIGLGTMTNNEFCDLNKLVASSGNHASGFEYLCP